VSCISQPSPLGKPGGINCSVNNLHKSKDVVFAINSPVAVCLKEIAMLKTEADRVLRSIIEETGAQFTEEQIACLVLAILKIVGRTMEEAFASYNYRKPGSRPSFFTE
jgi:hypothetical protein